MDYMARLNFKEGYPVTYDREEAEKVKLEMSTEEDRRRKLEDKKRKLKDQELMKREETLKMRELNLAKSLKDEGIPIDKIIKLTDLNKDQIMML